MSKLQLSLTSLIAVLPAGFLFILLVNVMLTNSQNLSTTAFLVLGVTLAAAGATVLIPAAIWVGGRGKPKLATANVSKESLSDESEDIESIDDDIEAVESSDDVSAMTSGSYDVGDALGDSDVNLDDSGEIMAGGSDIGGDLEADIETEPVEDFEDFDLGEDEEETKPKKKKK